MNSVLDKKLEYLRKLDALLTERGIEHTVHDGFGKYDRCASVSVGNCSFTEVAFFEDTSEGELQNTGSFLMMSVCDITPERVMELLDVMAKWEQGDK